MEQQRTGYNHAATQKMQEVAEAFGEGDIYIDAFHWKPMSLPRADGTVGLAGFFRRDDNPDSIVCMISRGTIQDGRPVLPEDYRDIDILFYTRDEWEAFISGAREDEFSGAEDTAAILVSDEPDLPTRSALRPYITPDRKLIFMSEQDAVARTVGVMGLRAASEADAA